jgi:hypothetical protein
VEDGSPNNVSFDATLIVLHEPVDTFKRRTLTAKKIKITSRSETKEKRKIKKNRKQRDVTRTSVAIHFRQFEKKTEK